MNVLEDLVLGVVLQSSLYDVQRNISIIINRIDRSATLDDGLNNLQVTQVEACLMQHGVARGGVHVVDVVLAGCLDQVAGYLAVYLLLHFIVLHLVHLGAKHEHVEEAFK